MAVIGQDGWRNAKVHNDIMPKWFVPNTMMYFQLLMNIQLPCPDRIGSINHQIYEVPINMLTETTIKKSEYTMWPKNI